MSNTLITKANKPRVMMVIGKVSISNMGFKKTFNIPRTMATTKAVTNVSTDTPGTMYAVTNTDKALTRSFISIFTCR